MRRYLSTIGTMLFFIALINFAIFVMVAVNIGGDAISGKVENGRYYLSNHGKLTEVSPAVWQYSKIHAISVWITHPLGLAGAALFVTRKATNK